MPVVLLHGRQDHELATSWCWRFAGLELSRWPRGHVLPGRRQAQHHLHPRGRLGLRRTGLYGQKQIKTPCLTAWPPGHTLHRLLRGQHGLSPSRCTLMTGLHTGHARIRGNDLGALAAGGRDRGRDPQAGGLHHRDHRQVGVGRGRGPAAFPTRKASIPSSAI